MSCNYKKNTTKNDRYKAGMCLMWWIKTHINVIYNVYRIKKKFERKNLSVPFLGNYYVM